MIINHNMNAMNAQRNMGINNTQSGKSMEKLSSGLRINRAGDDAAGLAISEKMRGQIRGLDQASRNSQDGISLIQTAEGALNETHSILQRMRELAVQAGNDTNTSEDRIQIQEELNQLTSEINRIGNTTEFNTQKLLNGNKAGSKEVKGEFSFTIASTAAGQKFSIDGTEISFAGSEDLATVKSKIETAATAYDVTVDEDLKVTLKQKTASTTGAIVGTNPISTALTPVTAGVAEVKGEYTFTVGATTSGKILTIDGEDVTFAGTEATYDDIKAAIEGVTNIANKYDVSVDSGKIKLTQKTGSATAPTLAGDATPSPVNTVTAGVAEVKGQYTFTIGTTASGTKINIDGEEIDLSGAADATAIKTAIEGKVGTAYTVTVDASNNVTLDQLTGSATAPVVSGLKEMDGYSVDKAGEISTVIGNGDGKIRLQIGANEGQSLSINIDDMRSLNLGISTTTTGTEGFTATKTVTDGTTDATQEYALDVSTHENAAKAITSYNKAIDQVSSQRAKLGALQNRLEHTIANLGTSSENLTAAESRVRDVDMAKEMMTYSKNNILQQAAQSMLAQANQQPQQVLQLLR